MLMAYIRVNVNIYIYKNKNLKKMWINYLKVFWVDMSDVGWDKI